ncbi:unnamed protein product, partial [Staurois parvus]
MWPLHLSCRYPLVSAPTLSQQSAAERRLDLLCQILHLSVQLQHPLISASPGLSIQQTLVTDSTPPLVLLQTLHFLLSRPAPKGSAWRCMVMLGRKSDVMGVVGCSEH